MRLKDYNDRVRQFRFEDDWVDKVHHATIGLSGETGEVAELIKKSQFYPDRGPVDRFELEKELGDVLFYVCWLADLYNIDQHDILETNIEKLNGRYRT